MTADLSIVFFGDKCKGRVVRNCIFKGTKDRQPPCRPGSGILSMKIRSETREMTRGSFQEQLARAASKKVLLLTVISCVLFIAGQVGMAYISNELNARRHLETLTASFMELDSAERSFLEDPRTLELAAGCLEEGGEEAREEFSSYFRRYFNQYAVITNYIMTTGDQQVIASSYGNTSFSAYLINDVQVMCLVVNPELRDELGIEINGYEDLLQPELKGKIILAAPDSTSSGYRQLQTILATMGDSFDDEKGWDYIARLIPQTFSTTSSKDVFNLVSTGEYVVGLSYESSVAALINDGAPIECVYMEEGNTAMAGGAAIVKTAPNLPAAQAMMDLLSSAEFQDARAQASAGRGSNTGCDLQGLPDESELGIVDLDFD